MLVTCWASIANITPALGQSLTFAGILSRRSAAVANRSYLQRLMKGVTGKHWKTNNSVQTERMATG